MNNADIIIATRMRKQAKAGLLGRVGMGLGRVLGRFAKRHPIMAGLSALGIGRQLQQGYRTGMNAAQATLQTAPQQPAMQPVQQPAQQQAAPHRAMQPVRQMNAVPGAPTAPPAPPQQMRRVTN